MVAFRSTRRQNTNDAAPIKTPIDALTAGSTSEMDSVFSAACSHRAVRHVEIRRDRRGELAEIRIGRWRVIAARENRRLAEVRELTCGRVVVRIERFADSGATPSSEIWQLYQRDGRLEAALQASPHGLFALLTNYRTRQACKLVANAAGELIPAETWKI